MMKQQDAKDQKLKEAKDKSKVQYRVQNNFTPKQNSNKTVKKGAKAGMFKSADEEVNQYMKELGLI